MKLFPFLAGLGIGFCAGFTLAGLAFGLSLLLNRWMDRDHYFPGWHTTLPRLVLELLFVPVLYAGTACIILSSVLSRWYDACVLKFNHYLRS